MSSIDEVTRVRLQLGTALREALDRWDAIPMDEWNNLHERSPELRKVLDAEVSAIVGGQLFIVVRKDRHVDDQITVHFTRASADAAIEEFKVSYLPAIEANEWHERDYGVPRWVRYVDSFDDGPKARIEITEIQ